MSDPSPADDDAFLAAFDTCTLPAGAFGHRAHLRVAWLMLRGHPPADAIERTCAGLARLAAHRGAASKFHRTRSEALMRLMLAAGAAAAPDDFAAFLERNPALLVDARGVLARHYSAAVLDSDAARTRYLPPDLEPLPA